jgi:1,4-alpha-glucan branching enzyme
MSGGAMAASKRTRISAEDLYLFNEGTHSRLYEKLGAHAGLDEAGRPGTFFAVWAPNAEAVSVIGDWNDWRRDKDALALRASSGVWEGFVAGVGPGTRYKYHIVSRYRGYRVDKADPVAFWAETPPRQASVVWPLHYSWGDGDWMAARGARQGLGAPISAYELHLGSWRRVPEEGNRWLTYRETAPLLAEHVRRMGFTHVELMPVMEHPFYGSWGYQGTGYFAATSRYGTPQDLMYLIDTLHQQGIGVLLDWVPSHFPTDEHGLAFFDGTHLYEHADPRRGVQPDWGSLIFNYGRPEVRSFLISSALFWLDKYHADGLRVDAVASMLYLDYSRRGGEWLPNRHGGRENLEAIEFLRACNSAVYQAFPDVQTVAEESTAWPMVSRPTWLGGLGFGFKWDMGWMHDTLDYLRHDPIHRKFHQNELTFRGIYMWTENFVLPLSHDEVVHGKGSLLAKMPGDAWQKLANLRLLFGWMVAQPGKKLLFMGAELANWQEWDHEGSLDWHLLADPAHAGVARWLTDLNRLYRDEPAMHQGDCDPSGFAWIDGSDAEHSVLAFSRQGGAGSDPVVAVFNFTPVPRRNYRIGVPGGGFWRELLNSDSPDYGGSGQGNFGGVEASPVPLHGRTHSLTLTLPPLGVLFLLARREAAEEPVASEQAEGEAGEGGPEGGGEETTASERAEGKVEPGPGERAEPPSEAELQRIERPAGVPRDRPTASERAEGAPGEPATEPAETAKPAAEMEEAPGRGIGPSSDAKPAAEPAAGPEPQRGPHAPDRS